MAHEASPSCPSCCRDWSLQKTVQSSWCVLCWCPSTFQKVHSVLLSMQGVMLECTLMPHAVSSNRPCLDGFRQAGRCHEGDGGHCCKEPGQGSAGLGGKGGRHLHYSGVSLLSVKLCMKQLIQGAGYKCTLCLMDPSISVVGLDSLWQARLGTSAYLDEVVQQC